MRFALGYTRLKTDIKSSDIVGVNYSSTGSKLEFYPITL